MPHQPRSWQEATATNIERIQQIFALDDTLKRDDKMRLYQQAHEMTARMTGGGTEYWGIFVNSLRTLVAGLNDTIDPKEIFD